jgi:hypothetical protein
MGIAGLLKNLHPLLVAPPTHPSNQQQNNNGGSNNNKIKVRHNIRQFANKSIAIDASGWLHKAAYTCAERYVLFVVYLTISIYVAIYIYI